MVSNVDWLCLQHVLIGLSDYEDEGYSDVDEEESDEEFNQKAEGISNSYSRMVNYLAPAISLGPRGQ